MKTTDMESEKRYASTSSSSSSYSSSCSSEEIEAAETLADLPLLAMTQTHAADKCCTKQDSSRFTRDSPIPDSELSRSPPPPGGQAGTGQLLDQNISTTASIEPERIHQNDCLRNIKVEQDTDLPKPGRRGKSRRNLTEEEKEARRIRRILANRESARQTIRRRQALSEELSKKASALVLENKNLKKEKELALKEYQSLETTNKLLKAQIPKSIKTEVEQTPVEAQVTPESGNNSPWFLYNRFPVAPFFWPSILQSSPNPVQLHQTPFNSIAIPSNVYVPCSSGSESPHKQKNHINDNRTQNPLYMFQCPWLYPLPEFVNGQSPPSSGVKDNQENLPLGKQCSTTSSLNTSVNENYQAALRIKQKTEVSSWTDAGFINDTGQDTSCFSLDRGEKKTRSHIIEKFHETGLSCSGHASAVKQEPDLQLYSATNTSVSSTASYITTTSLEKKQEEFICPGKILVDAVAASEARKRRRELTKLKGIQNRQS